MLEQGPHYIRTYLSCAIITIFRYICLILDIRAGALKLDILCALIKSFHGSVQHFIYCYSRILNIPLGKIMASILKAVFEVLAKVYTYFKNQNCYFSVDTQYGQKETSDSLLASASRFQF